MLDFLENAGLLYVILKIPAKYTFKIYVHEIYFHVPPYTGKETLHTAHRKKCKSSPAGGALATPRESGVSYSAAGPGHLREHHSPSLTLEMGTGSGSSNCRLMEASVPEEAVLSSMWEL